MVGSWNPSLGNHSLVSYVYYLIQRGNKQNYKIYLIFCRGTEYCHLYTKGYLPVENFFFFSPRGLCDNQHGLKNSLLKSVPWCFPSSPPSIFFIEPWKRVSLHLHQPTHALLIVLRVSVCVSSDACRLPSWNLYFFFLLLVPKWKQQCLWM